jgi:hypothetical protein
MWGDGLTSLGMPELHAAISEKNVLEFRPACVLAVANPFIF